MCEDYMSDSFLQINEENKKRKKVSTINSSSSSSSIEIYNKRRINELMEEKTKEGMERSIQSTNKGFQLLQKFGYIEGEGGLGKNNKGIENPLKIIKRDLNNK